MQKSIEELDDKELARLAKITRKPEYTEELLKRYIPLIRSQAARFANDRVRRDDLVSEGYLAVVRAVDMFDESKCRNFGSYLSVCIANRLVSALRNAEKNPVADEETPNNAKDNVTPETICLDKELFREIRKLLSELEYSVFELYIEGCSYRAIAEKLNISPKSADNAMQRIRAKLRILYEN